MGSVRPGDSLLYLVNAKLTAVVRNVEGGDGKCEGSDELESLGKSGFRIRIELQD